VDLYRSTPGATVQGIAADLGIGREALSKWVKQWTAEVPSRLPETGEEAGLEARAAPGPGWRGRPAGAAARMAALEAENAALRADAARRAGEHEAEVEKLSTERDILRQSAKYFAGETSW
jgi:transposase